MTKYTIILTLLFSTFLATAQAQNSADKLKGNYNDIVHLFRTDQKEEANHLISRALNQYPKHADFNNLKAIMVIYSGPVNNEANDRLAIKYLTTAILSEPNRAAFYNNRGWVYQFMNNYHLAKKDFDQAAKLEAENVRYAGNRLRLLFIQKKNKAAFALCNQLIKQFPKNGYAYHVRGHLKRDYLHKYLEGNKDIKKAKELDWAGGIYLVY